MPANLVLGIDATNLRHGGGVTHLYELLKAANPQEYGFSRVVIFGGSETLQKIEDRVWLEKISPPELERGLFHRSLWQLFNLSDAIRRAGCDVLFIPGGSYMGNFKPSVLMSQNLLPFDYSELIRYGLSSKTLRLLFLRFIQSFSFRHATGMIYLTAYAQSVVSKIIGTIPGSIAVIPHGLSTRFLHRPKIQKPISEYDFSKPYRFIYVSIVDHYKHQWNVVEAIAKLRSMGIPVALDLVGSAYPRALSRLDSCIAEFDPKRYWVSYHGEVPYGDLHNIYSRADAGIFASSCENLPIILLETMAAGLPVACSKLGPMEEVLGNAGLYFNPLSPVDIADSLCQLINSPELRTALSNKSYKISQSFSWGHCADETFHFLSKVAFKYKRLVCVEL